MQLGVVALQSTDVMQVAPELLRALLQMAGEAVNLAVFDADSMVLLYREQGPQSVTISSRLGSHRPMHASSLGKAFLSAMAESERRVLLSRLTLKRYTDQTITSPAALDREIAEIRARGFALDRSEFEATLACCAAAVFDHRGLPVAAISVSGPAERVYAAIRPDRPARRQHGPGDLGAAGLCRPAVESPCLRRRRTVFSFNDIKSHSMRWAAHWTGQLPRPWAEADRRRAAAWIIAGRYADGQPRMTWRVTTDPDLRRRISEGVLAFPATIFAASGRTRRGGLRRPHRRSRRFCPGRDGAGGRRRRDLLAVA